MTVSVIGCNLWPDLPLRARLSSSITRLGRPWFTPSSTSRARNSHPFEFPGRRNIRGFFSNTLLLLAQRPDATRVAGYTLWQQLGRQVAKGEKGLTILAPVTRRAGRRRPRSRRRRRAHPGVGAGRRRAHRLPAGGWLPAGLRLGHLPDHRRAAPHPADTCVAGRPGAGGYTAEHAERLTDWAAGVLAAQVKRLERSRAPAPA
jgi:N-terminal domain of anti-restriction factor ArdC